MTSTAVTTQPPASPQLAVRAVGKVAVVLCALAGVLVLDATAISSLARFAVYASTLAAAGLTIFAHLNDGDRDDEACQRAAPIVGGLAAVAVGGGVIELVARAGVVAGGTTIGGLDPASMRLALAGGWVVAHIVRLIGVTLLVLSLQRPRRSSVRLLMGSGAVWTIGSFTLTGHTAGPLSSPLTLLADLVHVAVAAVWFGGVVGLFLLVRHRPASVSAAAGAVQRFSGLMSGALVALFGTAVALAWSQLDDPTELFATRYGQVLLVKAAVVALVLGLGAYNHRRLVPSLLAGRGGWGELRRTVRMEAVGLATVIAITALLVDMNPSV